MVIILKMYNYRFSNITLFLIRLFITFLILVLLLIFDKISIIDYDKLKNNINYNINFVNIFNDFIGIKQKDEVIDVMSFDEYQYIDNYYICYSDDNKVYSVNSGYLYKIEYDENNLYTIYVLYDNDLVIKYQNINKLSINIYSKLKNKQMLGFCENYYTFTLCNKYEQEINLND